MEEPVTVLSLVVVLVGCAVSGSQITQACRPLHGHTRLLCGGTLMLSIIAVYAVAALLTIGVNSKVPNPRIARIKCNTP